MKKNVEVCGRARLLTQGH